MNRFVPDRGLDRDLAALVGLGLPTPEGFRGPGVKLRDWLTCRACGKRGTTLHHTVPNWIDYAGMVPAWRKGGIASLDPIRFVR